MNEIHQKQLTKWRSFITSFVEQNLGLICENDDVLEIGVGSLTKFLKNHIPQTKVLDKIKSPLAHYHINLFNVFDTLEKESQDFIFFIEVLEHTEQPFLACEIISELLKPNGTLLVTTPSFLFSHPGGSLYGDYWRFLPPKSFDLLFPALKKIKQEVCNDDVPNYPIGQTAIMKKEVNEQ